MRVVLFARRYWWCWCLLLLLSGCSRTHYRLKADQEAYCLIREKAACTEWQPPAGFSVRPDSRSRFFDPTPPDDPCLPVPAPRLYAYDLPALSPRDPGRFRSTQVPQALFAGSGSAIRRLPAVETTRPVDPAVHQTAFQQAVTDGQSGVPTLAPPATQMTFRAPGENGASQTPADPFELEAGPQTQGPIGTELVVVPLSRETWQSLPPTCLARMFEFASLREEYADSFGHEPSAEQRDQSQRLSLEDIIELTLINGRDYQTQKETLYRAALRLSLARFEYDLKFTVNGNGTAANYTHDRNAGVTTNRLGVPTTVTGDKLLATGGNLLARFANDVVLTFSGPQGFASEIGSELLLDISQSVFQRDIAFESLTQAERDLVYAARDFVRFRRDLFGRMASQYYSLLLSYRGIEIDSQDYFTNLRAFNQGQAEYRAGERSRNDVDQFEQNALRGRSSLIASCNRLESSLDSLKLAIGLPPEMPINLDLTELEELTLRDEATVAAERVRRARRNLISEQQRPARDNRDVLVYGIIDLTEKMLSLMKVRQSLGQQPRGVEELELLLAKASVSEARFLVRYHQGELTKAQTAVVDEEDATETDEEVRIKPPAVRVFGRTVDLADSLLLLVSRQLELAKIIAADAAARQDIQQSVAHLQTQLTQLRAALEEAVKDPQRDRIPELIPPAKAVLADTEVLARRADALTQYVGLSREEETALIAAHIQRLLVESDQLVTEGDAGLAPLRIGMDDAMLTALARRFDLMNDRGALADTWRQIKLAGDDLKSILNLNAAQVIRTSSGMNRPFGFTFDDSQTRVSITLDTPLNRKAQRNAFRSSLINYQAALRNLMQAEDNAKLSVRDDLRQLQLDREQYEIAAASAALAYERVVSIRLQLRLGVEGIAARDFLEAQTAYTLSLSNVANQHIGYLLDRIQLFLDLELLQVDDNGFWPELYNEEHQPVADLRWSACPGEAYGRLPSGVCYSKDVKRMQAVPQGTPEIHHGPAQQRQAPLPPPEALPTPAPMPPSALVPPPAPMPVGAR